MTLKVVPIQSKMTKPSLSEVVKRLENVFNNFTLRGEDKLNIVIASLSFCVWSLQKILDNDEEMMVMLDEVIDQYVDVPEDESYVELFTPDND
jgi:hypothetical protein|tara:strand:+ start:646 stop:924 length:279 start_codon:yes stop_codon:yes gene_type:complete